MPLEAVLFDFDGTLVDSEPVHYALWKGILAAHGHPLSLATYEADFAGVPTDANAALLVERLDLPITAEDLALAKNEAVLDYLSDESFPLMPYVEESLARLQREGLRLAVVTGAVRDNVEAALQAAGLRALFAEVVSGDDTPRNKPFPDPYLLALEHLGLQAHQCVALEDTGSGVAAASAAGIHCIAIPNRTSASHDFSRADLVARSMSEAIDSVLRRHHGDTPR